MLRDLAREKVRQLVEGYDSVVRLGKKAEYSEADVGSKFILPLLSALGWDVAKIEDVKEQRRTLTGVADYSLFNVGGTAKIFLELKKFEEDLDGSRRVGGKVKSFPQIAIDYAWQSRADWAVLTNFEEIRLYYSRVRKPEEGLIFKLKYHEYLENFDKLWLLSKESVVSGLLDTYEKRRLRRDVDEELLKDLVYCRRLLVSNVRKNNPQLSKEEINEATQKILDRLMFIRSCEDRLIIPAESLWTQFSVWQKIAIDKSVRTFMMDLKNIFRDFDAVYNGQLFAPHLCEDLRIDNEVLESVLILLYKYNFDLIPVNVLGNAYELYIGTIIKEKEGKLKEEELSLVEERSVRQKHGIYYTPEPIVDFLVKNTLGKILDNCKNVENVSKLKILDPACGSGSFLIKAFDILKEWYDQYNKRNQLLANRHTLDVHLTLIPNVEEKILTDNIYGVDLDPQAVEITILNLSLKVVKPKEKLPFMGDHIKCGNSLIQGTEENLKIYFKNSKEMKPFNWDEEFPSVFRDGGFDVIIGNPPFLNWTRGQRGYGRDSNVVQMLRFFEDHYIPMTKTIHSFNLFVEKAVSLAKQHGMIGFVLPYTFLTNLASQNIRRHILEKCRISCIVVIDEYIFEAIVKVVLLILENESDAVKRDENEVKIIHVKTLSDLHHAKYNISLIKQSTFRNTPMNRFLTQNPALLAIATRIEKDSLNLDKICDVKDCINTARFREDVLGRVAEGFFVSENGRQEKFNPQIHKKIIDGNEIDRYGIIKWAGRYIKYDPQFMKNKAMTTRGFRLRDEKIFVGKKILLRQTAPSTDPINQLIATIDFEGYYARNSLYSIKTKENMKTAVTLEYILALLNSKLMNFYYSQVTHEHVGLYPQIKVINLKPLPIRLPSSETQNEIVNLVEKIMMLKRKLSRVLTDFDRYVTEPIIAKTTFKEYYNKLDAKDKEALDKTNTGTIKRIKVEKQDSWLIFKVDYSIKKDKTKEEFTNVPVLKCKFEDVYFRKFLLHVFQNYKKRWGSGNLLSIILNTPIPCFDKNPDKNKQIIERIMKEFLDAVEEKERIEKEIEQTDNTINLKVYELYGLTPEEISIIETYLKQK